MLTPFYSDFVPASGSVAKGAPFPEFDESGLRAFLQETADYATPTDSPVQAAVAEVAASGWHLQMTSPAMRP